MVQNYHHLKQPLLLQSPRIGECRALRGMNEVLTSEAISHSVCRARRLSRRVTTWFAFNAILCHIASFALHTMTLTTSMIRALLQNAQPTKLAELAGCDPLALEAFGIALIWSICVSFEFCFVHWVFREAVRYRQCQSCTEKDEEIESDRDEDNETLAYEAYLGTFIGCLLVSLLVNLFVPTTPLSVSIYYWASFIVLSVFGIVMFGWLPDLSSVYARRAAESTASETESLLIV